MACHSDWHDLVLQAFQYDHLHSSGLKPVPPRVPNDESVGLLDANIYCPNRVLEFDDAINTALVTAQPAVAGFHSRVEDRVLRQDIPDAALGDAVLLGDLDEAAMFGMSAARVARPVSRELL